MLHGSFYNTLMKIKEKRQKCNTLKGYYVELNIIPENIWFSNYQTIQDSEKSIRTAHISENFPEFLSELGF